MSMDQLIAELESLGMEFSWNPRAKEPGAWHDIEPILPPQEQARLERLKSYAADHWDAFYAAVQLHLWRKEGVIR